MNCSVTDYADYALLFSANLNEAMRGLEEVTDSLRDFLDVINNVLSRFQVNGICSVYG